MRFQIGTMNIERCIRDPDFASKQQHRYTQRGDGAKEHDASNVRFVNIGRDHRHTGLNDANQAQPIAQAADLQQEPFGILWRNRVPDHFVMKMSNEIRQHRMTVAKIDYHMRNCRKQHANDQYAPLHSPVLCLEGSIT